MRSRRLRLAPASRSLRIDAGRLGQTVECEGGGNIGIENDLQVTFSTIPPTGGPDELGERLRAPRPVPERRRLSSNRLGAHL